MLVKTKTSAAETIARAVCGAFSSMFEAVETPPEFPAAEKPAGSPWEALIAAVKTSGMTEAMQTACVAQAALESARGTSRVSSECRNFWGIKMRPELEGLAVGRSVPVTSEAEGVAVFAEFKTVADAVKGWLKFLSRSYYAGWEKYRDDARAFLRHIGKSWCPAAGYADKVIALLPEASELLGAKIPTPTSKKKTIALDSGHSISEPGAHGAKGAKEEVLNILQADLIKKRLEKSGFDVRLVAGKTNDLEGRGEQAEGCAAFISLHHNSYDGNSDPGTEVFCTTDSSAKCRELAAKISADISKAIGITNRGVKINNWTVIKTAAKTGCPVVMLVESYFVNMYTPAQAEARSTAAANAIADALIVFFA